MLCFYPGVEAVADTGFQQRGPTPPGETFQPLGQTLLLFGEGLELLDPVRGKGVAFGMQAVQQQAGSRELVGEDLGHGLVC